jgi:signal transduction histidine kinase
MKSQVMPQPVVTPLAGLATTPRMLAIVDRERAAREKLEWLARAQAALHRVAALVTRAAPPEELFSAVTEEAGHLLSVDRTALRRYDRGRQTLVAAWSRTGAPGEPGRPVRPGGEPATEARDLGRGCVGAPVRVQGRLWGVMHAASAGEEPLPAGTAARLAGFTQLVAAAIGNAGAQAELTASRARIAAAADETRRRIERDLHDGAQQRLVSLGLQLRAAQAAVPAGLDGLRAELGQVAAGLTSTLDELREYARGIHPAILTDSGLAAALKTLARRSPVPVRLQVRTTARLPGQVELAAYYVASEALTNAAKHANATAVHITLEEAGGTARLSVSDDGAGGADPARGSGLAGLKDRVAATGGTLLVHSRPGEGTRLVAEFPARPVPAAA